MRGMQPSDIYHLSHAGDIRVSPDGARAVFTVTTLDHEKNAYRSRIWLVDRYGSAPRPLTKGDSRDVLPRWRPDGGLVAFVTRLAGGARSVRVAPTDGPGGETVVCEWPDEVDELAWSPDGDRLAMVGRKRSKEKNATREVPKKPEDMPPRRVTTLLSRLNGEGFVFDRPAHLWVFPLDGSAAPLDLTPGPWPVTGATWSPDGQLLAFASARHEGWDLDGRNDLWVVAAAGNDDPYALTDTSAEWSEPSWSPDGGRVAFICNPTPFEGPRHGRVGVIDVTTLETRDLMGDLDRNAGPYSLARPPLWVGEELLFSADDGGRVPVYSVPADGNSGPRVVLAGDRVISSFDAAGGTLGFVATSPTELPEAWLAVFDGKGLSSEQRVTNLSRTLRERAELVQPERFVAKAPDGAEVECWAMQPLGGGADESAGHPHPGPAILNIHGGPFTQYGYGLFDEFQLQVGAGFGVLYCNPRGSSGYSEAWGRAIRWPEAPTDPGSGWGGVDFDDVMACVDEACRRFEWVDLDRLGIQGGSYGGYLTSWAVTHTDRFKAACSERAANNLLTLEHNSDYAGWFRDYVGHTHVERPDLYESRSPTTYVTQIRTPLLIVHSEDDLRCPVDQAEQLFVALRLLGREPELVRFPAETHELSRSGSPRHRVMRAEIILEWFARHLK